MPYKGDIQVISGVSNPPAEQSAVSCGHARGTGSYRPSPLLRVVGQNGSEVAGPAFVLSE